MFSKRKYLIAMQCISDDKNMLTMHGIGMNFQGCALGLHLLVAIDHCVLVLRQMQPCNGVNKHLACQQRRCGTLDPQSWVIPVPCSLTMFERNNKDSGLLQSLKTLTRWEEHC
jgi:hypothetical protein